MENLLGEHGETLVYGIIGVVVILIICSVCESKWKSMTPEYKTNISKSNGKFISENKDKYPVIEVDEIIYAQYKAENFNCKDYVKAKDCDGKDITDRVIIYGTVDTFKKGIYKVRCVVMDDNQLACTKYINVIVE